jgi:hypothetical protein
LTAALEVFSFTVFKVERFKDVPISPRGCRLRMPCESLIYRLPEIFQKQLMDLAKSCRRSFPLIGLQNAGSPTQIYFFLVSLAFVTDVSESFSEERTAAGNRT